MATKFFFFAALILFLFFEIDGASLGQNGLCGGTKCYFYSYCDQKTLQCVCPSVCTMEFNPVCGSDGTVYSNPCSMRLSSCQQQKLIKEARRDTCNGWARSAESKVESDSFDENTARDAGLLDEPDNAEEMTRKDIETPDYVLEGKEEEYKEPIDYDNNSKGEVKIITPEGEQLFLMPETARDLIQAEINRLTSKYSEELPGIGLLTLPPVEYLEMYSEVELAGDILCILRQIEILIPPVKVALDELLSMYGAEIGITKLEDFEIVVPGSGSGDGSGSVQLGDCPDVKALPEVEKLVMETAESAAVTELTSFIETLLLSEIELNQRIKAKYAQ